MQSDQQGIPFSPLQASIPDSFSKLATIRSTNLDLAVHNETEGGAFGSGAPRGNKNALKHGLYTQQALKGRRRLRDLLRQSRQLIRSVN
jgi:hypothetical protein